MLAYSDEETEKKTRKKEKKDQGGIGKLDDTCVLIR